MKSEKKARVYWCKSCKVPVISDSSDKVSTCKLCGNTAKYMCSDVQPVFPEERLLVELIFGKPFEFIEKSVWCSNSIYFVNGKKYRISNEMWNETNAATIKSKLEQLKSQNTYEYFNLYAKRFILANKKHFNEIRFEAMEFIRKVMSQYEAMPKYISFSGGKDSTVTSDLVLKASANPSIPHIYCDTTLESPYTLQYVERIKNLNPYMILKTVRNKEHDFYSLCDDIGVPSSPKRWCCTIFKTGVISKKLKALFGDKKLIYFNGIRKSESNLRSKYERLSMSNEQKIQNQISVSPIIDWIDADVWLYILSEDIDFNFSYRLGFSRVGCYCCPNSSMRNETLCRIYIQDKANKWIDYLYKFSNRIGAENPYEYVHKGLWKSKQGGKGIKSYDEISFSNKVCTIDENAVSYDLGKSINDEFYTLFIPFGKVCKNLGKKFLDETFVLRNNVPIISIQVERETIVKIKTMNVSDHHSLRKQIENQLTKFKLCRRCYKCEAACAKKAISIENDQYVIDENKCIGCLACVKNTYIHDGCMMKRYLRMGRSTK